MNTILDFLNSHSSIRDFTDKEISREEELKIITAAQRSPTSSNLQAYSIIGIRNQNTKDKLSILCGNQLHVKKSSIFLVFCADLYRLKQICDKRNYNFNGDYAESAVIAIVDATLAASRALMAAQSLSLGGVMVGGIRNNLYDVTELLKLPKLLFPVMGMSLGHPAKDAKIKPRLPLKAIYHQEAYSDTDFESAIENYDKTIDELGYLRTRHVEPEKYPDFNGLYSWSEHTARRMATDNPKSVRVDLKKYLREQGFKMI